MSDRLYFEDPQDADNTITAHPNEDGGLTVTVSEERAVDSYNQMFNLMFALSRAQALELRDHLNRWFP